MWKKLRMKEEGHRLVQRESGQLCGTQLRCWALQVGPHGRPRVDSWPNLQAGAVALPIIPTAREGQGRRVERTRLAWAA